MTSTIDLYSSCSVLEWLRKRSLEAEALGDLTLLWGMAQTYQRRHIKDFEDWCEFPVGWWIERLASKWGEPCGFGAMAELSGLVEDPHVLRRLL